MASYTAILGSMDFEILTGVKSVVKTMLEIDFIFDHYNDDLVAINSIKGYLSRRCNSEVVSIITSDSEDKIIKAEFKTIEIDKQFGSTLTILSLYFNNKYNSNNLNDIRISVNIIDEDVKNYLNELMISILRNKRIEDILA